MLRSIFKADSLDTANSMGYIWHNGSFTMVGVEVPVNIAYVCVI